jgi:DNA-binding LytR/AlgR family response regulator
VIGLLLYLIFILSYSLKTKQTEQKNSDSYYLSESNKKTVSNDVKQEPIDRITVKTGQKLHIISLQEIMYLQSDGDYVQVITKEGTHLKEQTMKYFETHLPQNMFVRIHRTCIVNIEYIARIESYGKQNHEIALKNGKYLKMSISGYKLLKDTLGL